MGLKHVFAFLQLVESAKASLWPLITTLSSIMSGVGSDPTHQRACTINYSFRLARSQFMYNNGSHTAHYFVVSFVFLLSFLKSE